MSWEAFTPIARCSYVMYLMHMCYVDILPGMRTFKITFEYFDIVSQNPLKLYKHIIRIQYTLLSCSL